jgi:hypothetical protein
MLRSVTRAAKKGVNGITRSMKKIIHRGGDPTAVPGAAPAAPPPSRKRRKAKGALRRVTNAVRRVGKRFRNTLTSVFSTQRKHRSRRKKGPLQKGSSEETVVSSSGAVSSPGIPPAPPV